MAKIKPVKVSYRKRWGKDGTCYTQAIKLNKSFVKYINKLIKYYWKSSEEVKETFRDNLNISSYYDYYIEELKGDKIIPLTLTQLKIVFYYLSINGYDVGRILNRNTLLIIE